MADTRFVSFIFNDSEQSRKQWVDAYTSFQCNPTQISAFLEDREVSGSFIAGFEVYALRITSFVQQIPRHNISKARERGKEEPDMGQHLGRQVIKKIIIPLLEFEYQHLHARDALLELLFSTISLADRSTFEQLAAQLGKASILLGKLISDQRCRDLIRDWIGLIKPKTKTMQDWVGVSVNLAKRCDSDHGVLSATERWDQLTTLKFYLHRANPPEPSIETFQRRPPVRKLPTNLRVVGYNEDFDASATRISSTSTLPTLDISPEGLTLLDTLGIRVPRSKRVLENTINLIETTETFPIFEAVLNTFPCRLCFTRGYGNSSDPIVPLVQTDFEREVQTLDSDSFEGLLGGGLGVWKISLSTQALKDLKNSQREGNFHHIKSKLEALASGDWIRKAVAGEAPEKDKNHRFRVRVFQAFYGSNGRILWQVDVGFDEKQNADSQIVRVWRIGDVKEIHNSLDSVYRAQQGFSPTRVERCKMNLIDKKQKKKIPVVFGEIDQQERDTVESTDERLPQDMLISGKFHTLTGTVFESILRGQSHSDFPFDVTGKEVEIIKNKNATFILGRSGTGKTSCLLYKLMSRYLARNIAQPETPIRQLLLTRSEPLARKLESEVQLLIDTQLLRVKAGFDYLDDGEDFSLQIRDGMDEDTTEDFLSMQKEHFPLVCTFGHFLTRLENTIRGNNRKDFSIGTRAGRSRRLVDFVIFKEAYWTQFPGNMKGGLEPDLVFSEIMGVIKGAATLLTGLKSLSQEEYRAISNRLAPTFAKIEDRDVVYRIFESYENKKKQIGDYDGIDRVRTILEELNENTVLRRRIETIFEEVYVDEVQDQRPLEIELLLNIVQNPRGIHFEKAGDSAQCISKDSTFRFANLKALFFNHFSASRFTKIDPSVAKPELFSLSRNFRSHQGILSLASFVMELLWKGFPDMVDKLPPEIGQYLGPKPVIYVGSDLVEFLQMAGGSTGAPGKGDVRRKDGETAEKQIKTQQIIIMRDHTNQEELQNKLGDGSVVFTVLQSKGMEYDDVFLYNFFSSSPCWRGFKSLQELLAPGANSSYGVNHMSMCSELKNLYVAITRPRSRLWILENDPGFIPELLAERIPHPLVEIRHFRSEELLLMIQEVRPTNTTTAKEWVETGDQCMERGLFDQALRCFNNADDPQKIMLAEACIAEKSGKECQARHDLAGLNSHFKDAGDRFFHLNMKERAANCLEARGEFKAAAELYRVRGRYEKAAGLFMMARLYEQAAQEYHKAGKTLKALQSLHKGKLYERLVEDVHRYRYRIEDGDRKSYARECNILLRRKETPPQIGSHLSRLTFDMFISDSEKEEFLAEFEYKKELLEFYLNSRRIKDAFFYSIRTGDIDNALELIIDWVQKRGTDSEMEVLKDIFNHSQTGRILTKISTASSGGVDLSCDKRYSGKNWSQPWENLVLVTGQYVKTGRKLDRGCINEGWIRNYMDIIVSINVPYFLKLGHDLGDLPLDYICWLAEMINGMSEGKEFPPEALCALGVLHIPGRSRPYIILKWSRLPLDTGGVREFNYDRIMEKAFIYLTEQVRSACSLIEERGLVLMSSSLRVEECYSCVTRVAWDRPEKVGGRGSKCSHNLHSKAQFERFIQGLVAIISYFIKLEYLDYFTLKDYLLDTLLAKLIHRSSLFEAAEATVTVHRLLHKPESAGVLGRLRDRFLQYWQAAMHAHMGSKQDFLALLGNFQLARYLGLEQSIINEALVSRASADIFQSTREAWTHQEPQKRQGRRGGWGGIWDALTGSGREKQPRKIEKSRDFVCETFMRYNALYQWVHPYDSRSMGILSEKIDSLLQSLSDLKTYTQCMSSYHESVITIYEEILTFLIFSTTRTDVVIPESWVKLHLPRWAESFKMCTGMEQCCYQQVLLRAVSSFCDWVIKLESSPQCKPGEPRTLPRRCVDLLVISLINIGTAGVPLPLGYQEIWTKIQKVFGNNTLGTSKILDIQPHRLMEPLTRAFQLYNGKDSLLVYIREGRVSKRVEAWHRAAVQFKSIPLHPSLPEPPSMSAVNSIYLIKTWYRTNKDRLARHKIHLKGATGLAVTHIYNFCKNHGAQLPSRRRFLEFVAVMMVEGLELYLALQVMSSQIHASREIPVVGISLENERREFAKYYEAQLQLRSEIFSMGSPITFSLEASACRTMFRGQLAVSREMGERITAYIQRLKRSSETKLRGKGNSNLNAGIGSDGSSSLPKGSQDVPRNIPEVGRKSTVDELLWGGVGQGLRDQANIVEREVGEENERALSNLKPHDELDDHGTQDAQLGGTKGGWGGESQVGGGGAGEQEVRSVREQRGTEPEASGTEVVEGEHAKPVVVINEKGKNKGLAEPISPQEVGDQQGLGAGRDKEGSNDDLREAKKGGDSGIGGTSQNIDGNPGGSRKANKKRNRKKNKGKRYYY